MLPEPPRPRPIKNRIQMSLTLWSRRSSARYSAQNEQTPTRNELRNGDVAEHVRALCTAAGTINHAMAVRVFGVSFKLLCVRTRTSQKRNERERRLLRAAVARAVTAVFMLNNQRKQQIKCTEKHIYSLCDMWMFACCFASIYICVRNTIKQRSKGSAGARWVLHKKSRKPTLCNSTSPGISFQQRAIRCGFRGTYCCYY